MITGRQIRAARGLLGWDASALAEKAGISRETISNIENGAVQPRGSTLNEIARTFNEHGVEFTDNQGVRFKSNNLEVFEGADRFQDFSTIMHDYLDRYGGDVCISVTDERILQACWKNIEAHRAHMIELVKAGKVTGRILASEGNFIHTWADLRRQPHNPDTPQVSFFAFGDYLALISFDNKAPPYIVLHKSGPFAHAYKTAFDAAWEKAGTPT